jgi:hypothetical protein
MSNKRKRWFYGAAIGIVLLVLLLVFRLNLLFAGQRMRLSQLDCPAKNRTSLSAPLDQLPVCEKLWAHRVNSYERFLYLKDYFSGLETDVVFDAAINNFRVYHPPAPASNLLLDVYFKELKAGNKGLWIDVKGIDSTAYQQAVDYFEACDRLYNIKKYVIIEASSTRFINSLAERGFVTSYLVPLNYLQPKTPGRVTDSLAQQLLPAVKFISQEDRYLPALQARFHNRKIITWALSFSNYFDLSHFKSLINGANISVVLINCKSSGYL